MTKRNDLPEDDVSGRHPASYRDPAGFIFWQSGKLYRQVCREYHPHYRLLIGSGLYDALTEKGWLLAHRELPGKVADEPVLEPAFVEPLNYPYEWSFDMLKDAGLLTLRICREAITHGMILKDATAFNIVFVKGRPVFIDTLSFETYRADQPWVAYRQFCQQFLFPLLLARYGRGSFQSYFLADAEGMTARQVACLLPRKTLLHAGPLLHVHLAASVLPGGKQARPVQFSREKMSRLLSHLEHLLVRSALPPVKSAWSHYYSDSILGDGYLQEKEQALREMVKEMLPGRALDLGANDGFFSKVLSGYGWDVIAFDADERAVNNLYRSRGERAQSVQPLWMNLVQASPAIGWMGAERAGFWSRFRGELVLALALVHHLYFRYNLPFAQLAQGLDTLCTNSLVIEFVEPGDPKVEMLAAGRTYLLAGYNNEAFCAAMSVYFTIEETVPLAAAGRILYRMKKKQGE